MTEIGFGTSSGNFLTVWKKGSSFLPFFSFSRTLLAREPVEFLRLSKTLFVTQNSSCHETTWKKNLKITYFNATDNYHHLIKPEAHHIPVEEFAFSLLRLRWGTISKLSGMDDHMPNCCCCCCFFSALPLYFTFLMKTNTWQWPRPSQYLLSGAMKRHLEHHSHPTFPHTHTGGCLGGLSWAAQAPLPPSSCLCPPRPPTGTAVPAGAGGGSATRAAMSGDAPGAAGASSGGENASGRSPSTATLPLSPSPPGQRGSEAAVTPVPPSAHPED